MTPYPDSREDWAGGAPLRRRADDPTFRARVAWSRLAEPADPLAGRLVREHGPEAALAMVRAGASGAGSLSARVASLDVDADLERADDAGAQILVPGDDLWPAALDELTVPPYCLWVRGRGLDRLGRSVAIVGSRAATAYGERVAEELGAGLAERGYTVVSGAAYGIDGAAHRGALAGGGLTVAVVAGGVDRLYPTGHARLIDEIARRGAVVSEVPPGCAPTRSRFLTRNRLIAVLTQGTVVVEAALRSGSLNTARWARTLGRQVGVVPGPVTSMSSAGCHQAVRDGYAVLVTDADEVVELVGAMGELAPVRQGPVRPEDGLDPSARQVFAALPLRRPAPLAALARSSGRSEGEVRAALGAMQLVGLVERVEGGWRRCPSG